MCSECCPQPAVWVASSKQVSLDAKIDLGSDDGLVGMALIDVHQLASVVKNRIENVLIVDSRSFIEYNTSHVASAVNICCSKIVKRRLQQDKLSVKELLSQAYHCDVDPVCDLVVYDQQSVNWESLPADSFTAILLGKLQKTFSSVNLLSGGFTEFSHLYPELCGDKVRKFPPLSSLSQPCLPIADQGPTRILPFLYLGSQLDALNKELLKDHNITYELNVSTNCPKPDFLPDTHFLRIPVNDNYSEKLLPHFPEAFRFLDKVSEANCCVLVHCLAGISRSPTIAIAYVMRCLRLTSDDGYRYVKAKRPTISPNFNFLGQLLDFEKQLKRESQLAENRAPPLGSKKRRCKPDARPRCTLSLQISPASAGGSQSAGEQSPTSALAKLSFSGPPTPEGATPSPVLKCSKSYECLSSCYSEKASKILSPVKEIKCESLISEISWGSGEQILPRSKDRRRSPRAEAPSSKLVRGPASDGRFPAKQGKKCLRPFDVASQEAPKGENSTTQPASHFLETYPAISFHLPYTRSDSAATSGFGSESSDCTSEDLWKVSDDQRNEFGAEDLEDDVMLGSAESKKQEQGLKFTFIAPAVPLMHSPLSPSERHLLEDTVASPTSSQKFGSGSPVDARHPEFGLSGHASFSRKRTAQFEASASNSGTQFPDKRKCELSSDRPSKACATSLPEVGSDSGLYRVQSCPGMSSASGSCGTSPGDHRHSIDSLFADWHTSGSCPGSLHYVGPSSGPHSTPSSPHHRDFRRNARLIRVS